MQRTLAVGYALVAYLFFFAVFLWLVGFMAGLDIVPTSVDRSIDGRPVGQAVLVDVLLIALFGVQHSVMARGGFKRWIEQAIPASVERATYVIAASAALLVLLTFWHTLPGTVWDLRGSAAAPILWAAFAIGWAVLLISTFLINHFELFGLAQAWRHGSAGQAHAFHTPLFYRWVRHPLYLGFIIAFWATPLMSVSHLLFALGMTGYILVGIAHEEKDLAAVFGRDYRDYQSRVGMLIPGIGVQKPSE